MKGQYLAIETVLTFAMGITLALGTVTVFSDYRSDIVDTTTEKQVQIIQSEVRNSIFHLKSSDSGYIELELPSEVGGSDYRLTLDDGTHISVNQEKFEKEFPGLKDSYEFSGTVSGGTVKIYKNNNQFILRSG